MTADVQRSARPSARPTNGARHLAQRLALLVSTLTFATAAGAQTTISGTVLVAENGEPAHDAEVVLLETDQVAHSDADGRFQIELADPLPAITLHVDVGFLSGVRSFEVNMDASAFELPEPILLEAGHRTHEHVTVTASAGETSPFEAFGSVQSFEGLALQNEAARNIAELLEATPGVAMRSSGPGAARPILRGFDGDRVLVMEDGASTGDLGSTSGHHGVPVDPLQAERVEVVLGPATLLYGSNAIGGAVNVISMASHLAHSPPPGFRGQANLDFSTADEGLRGGVRAQTAGNGWFAWGGGNSNRTGDYDSPEGVVENSASSLTQGEAGFGLFGARAWWSSSVKMDDSRYGVPFGHEGHAHGHEDEMEEDGHHEEEEEEGEEHHGEMDDEDDHGEELAVDVVADRRQFRTDFGIGELGSVFESLETTVRYSDYEHDEVETPLGTTMDQVATNFQNQSLVVRAELKRPTGRVQSRLGVWGNFRHYEATGEEALAPATDQTALAAFSYNEIQATDRLSLLLGTRIERNAYEVGERADAGHAHEEEEEEEGHEHEGEEEEGHHGEEEEDDDTPPPAVDRDFLAASTSAGLRYSLSDASTLVATGSLATRAPSIEELYNYGIHGGLAFEIGNPNLDPERSLGLDLSLRHTSERFTGSFSAFRYDISNFVIEAETAAERRGLPVVEFLQSDAVYQGFEVETHIELGVAELVANASYVDARLTARDQYAPRIPPLNGQVKLEVPAGRLRIVPRMRWAARMDRLYPEETPTDGYAVFDLTASYVFVGHHTTSNISLRAYNITDAEYRHHTSLIKDRAPQIGRGFRISYSLRFF